MALQISVAPTGDRWAVRSEALDTDLLFDGGGRAEAAARELAENYARTGLSAEVRVFLRDGALAGTYVHRSESWAA